MLRRANTTGVWHFNLTDEEVRSFVLARQVEATAVLAGNDRPVADLEAAAAHEALAALSRRSPAFSHARSLIEFGRIAPIPLSSTLEQTGPALETVQQAVDWFTSRPADGIGVLVGDRGAYSVLAIEVEEWACWQSWLRAHACEIRTLLDENRPEEQRFHVHLEPPAIGQPARVEWWPINQRPLQPLPPVTYRGGREGREAWDQMTTRHRLDFGGYVLWSAPGGLMFSSRQIADGLRVMPSGAIVPYRVTKDGRVAVKVTGGFWEPTPEKMAPAWLLDEVEAGTVQRVPSPVPTKEQPAGDYDVLQSIAVPSRRPAESFRPWPRSDEYEVEP